jgi:AhpD family alkylhydroperoxidase
VVPGGIERNRESSADAADAGEGVTEAMLDVCFDPQTSGGLLVALEPEAAETFVARLRDAGNAVARAIGRVTGKGAGRVAVRTTRRRTMPAPTASKKEASAMATPNDKPFRMSPDVGKAEVQPCCAEPGGGDEACCAPSGGHATGEEPCCAPPKQGAAAPRKVEAEGARGIEEAFKAFMGKAGKPGALDVATKQALNVALSVLAKCEPCLKTHIKKAREMGFTQEEIDEAAWMAIAFGGSPVMMFYKEVLKQMEG